MTDDERWMAAALALGRRGRGRTAPNPPVGCVIVRDARVVGRGWTQPGGRPHAEAMALLQAGEAAHGATAYVTLEPCARPGRGPACAGALIRAGVARVVAAIGDPFPAVDGAGFRALEDAGVALTVGPGAAEAERSMAGFLMRQRNGRPHVTLKLATSLDGRIALADGTSRWITGGPARAHAHLERSRHEAILVGRGTWQADAPTLDVRLPGLEERSPRRLVLSRGEEGFTRRRGDAEEKEEALLPQAVPVDSANHVSSTGDALSAPPRLRANKQDGNVEIVHDPADIVELDNIDHLLIEGGAGAAAAFLREDLVDRLLLYRAPILIGDGRPALGDIGLASLAEAHGRWTLVDARALGSDRLEVYERVRKRGA